MKLSDAKQVNTDTDLILVHYEVIHRYYDAQKQSALTHPDTVNTVL